MADDRETSSYSEWQIMMIQKERAFLRLFFGPLFALLYFGLLCVCLYGWVENIISIFDTMHAPLTGLFVLRIIGVIVIPFVPFLGYLFLLGLVSLFHLD